MTESGTELCWDNEGCPRDDCDGELQQQDRFNVMCLSCEGVWTHVKSETKHYLQTADFETVAEKPVAMTDGGADETDSARSATYGYVSLMRCSMENPEWEMDEGEKALYPGKKPEVWMPRVFSEERDTVVGRRYEREALIELPERMKADDALDWAQEHQPEPLDEWFEDAPTEQDDVEVMTDGGADQPEMDQSVEARPRVEDGALVVEFGDGTELHLEVNATEWTHESPKQGSSVDLKAEVEHFDEHVYWHLYPSRSEMPITGPADFPVVEIAPSVVPPYKQSEHEQHYAVEFTVTDERCTTDSFTFEEDAERMRDELEERDALDDVSVIEIGGDRDA